VQDEKAAAVGLTGFVSCIRTSQASFWLGLHWQKSWEYFFQNG